MGKGGGGVKGLAPHHDDVELFVCQTEGGLRDNGGQEGGSRENAGQEGGLRDNGGQEGGLRGNAGQERTCISCERRSWRR